MSEESARDIAPTSEPVSTAAEPAASAAEPPASPAEPAAPAEAAAPTATPAKPTYPFSVLKVLATAWRVTQRNLLPFLVLTCVLEVPCYLMQHFSRSHRDGDMLLAMAVQMIAGSLTTAVVSYGVIMDMNGSRPSIRACLAHGLSSLWRVLGVSLFSAFAIMAAMLLLIIPGIIVSLMLFVVVPVTVVENIGLDAAMKRSRQLTAGRKGDLFVIGMALGAITVVGALIGAGLDPLPSSIWLATSSAISTTFFAVVSAVVYVVLRQLRDGTTVPELAVAFARVRK